MLLTFWDLSICYLQAFGSVWIINQIIQNNPDSTVFMALMIPHSQQETLYYIFFNKVGK